MDHLANGMKIKTPPDHKRMKYLAQCVCVWVSQSVSRVPVLIFAVAAAAAAALTDRPVPCAERRAGAAFVSGHVPTSLAAGLPGSDVSVRRPQEALLPQR